MKPEVPARPTAEHYAWAIRSLWLSVHVLAAMPLEQMRTAQLEAIDRVKLDNPELFAKNGQAVERDATITRIMLAAQRELKNEVPDLKAIEPKWPALPPIASPRH